MEYKYAFSSSDEFNHPLIVTNQIVCWDIPIGKDKDQVSDSYNYFGTICLTDELEGVGYEIIDIQSRDGDYHGGQVKVVSLKKLLDITFDCVWVTPPPRESTSTAKRKRA